MSSQLFEQNLQAADAQTERMKPIIRNARMRQHYHFMAEAGWINDPNGLVFYKGKYHIFYQHNPFGSFWGRMFWGHAVSDNLMHWKHLPHALAPSEHYDDHPEGGCFSGSAIVYKDRLYLVYTGTTNYGNGFVQTQCLAWSDDGVYFKKYDLNPIITAPEGYDAANFRDPKIFRHGEYFYLICGAKKGDFAQALIYRSDDIRHWEYLNVMAESKGEFGYMWECPDFYPLGDKYVLMFSPMGVKNRTSIYLVGSMNFQTGKFDYYSIGEVDSGFDYYAPQSFSDDRGRRLLIGWANAWDWMPWWKDWGPSFKEHWCGFFSLIREARLCEDNRIQFKPVEEYRNLRKESINAEMLLIRDQRYQIKAGDGIAYEMELYIDLKQTTAKKFQLFLHSDDMFESIITVDLEHSELIFDRNNSDSWSKGIAHVNLKYLERNEMKLHIYSDQSSIEVYTDDYQTIISCNVFAENTQNHNYIAACDGMVCVKYMEAWEMESVF